MRAEAAIRPIRTDRDHKAGIAEIESLWDSGPGTPEHDRLEVLATLVDDYESKRWPIEPPDPVEAIKLCMEQKSLSRRDMERYLGSRARVSEILNRRRHLTLPMIWKLHRNLGIPAASLIKPYRLKRPDSSQRRP
jgi:HTH-type transcriptional regulator/antitoxin HigA